MTISVGQYCYRAISETSLFVTNCFERIGVDCKTMTNRKRLARATALVLTLVPMLVMAGNAPSLKEIMQGLRDNLVEISDGLLTDDFDLIAQGAASIAEHPRIPAAQVQLVAAELGPEMTAFKQLDHLVHELSLEIGAAATALDRNAAISGYQRIVEGCLDCHSAYKERVAAALKPEPNLEPSP